MGSALAVGQGMIPRDGNVRLRLTLSSIATARSRCGDVNDLKLEREVLAFEIEARAELLQQLGLLRDQIMHERFGILSFGLGREQRRRLLGTW